MDRNKEKTQKFITKALNKMFRMVGFKDGFDEKFVNLNPDNWYQLKQWTKENEYEFEQFFIENIRKDLKMSKKSAKHEFLWFNLNYCWKTKE